MRKYLPRICYTKAYKALMWDRWRAASSVAVLNRGQLENGRGVPFKEWGFEFPVTRGIGVAIW